MRRASQLGQRLLDSALGRGVGYRGILVIVEERVRHDFHAPVAVIEDNHQTHDHENHFRQLEVVLRRRGHRFFKITGDVVSEKPDRTAGKTGQVWCRDEFEPCHDAFQGRQGIRTFSHGRDSAILVGAGRPFSLVTVNRGLNPRKE